MSFSAANGAKTLVVGMIDVVLTDINLGAQRVGCSGLLSHRAAVLYISGDRIDFERCVPGSMFVAKPLNRTKATDPQEFGKRG